MSPRSPADLAVDIVINNHNYGAFLADAIESACAQSHRPVTVIAVDDGSGDDSREVLRGYGDRIIAVLKENGGQASALNAGMERCRGDVVIFLDADDVLHADAARLAAGAFAGDERVAKVQFRMDVIDAEGRPTGELKPAAHLPLPSGDVRAAELAYPYDLVWMATSANAFRTEALRRIFPIPEDRYPRTGADWYLVHLGALLGRVASLEDVGASYRVHGANSYGSQTGRIDPGRVRQAVEFAAATSPQLLRLAAELDLPRPRRILSIADLANRMASLRLEPALHPIAADSRVSLILDAARAARRGGGVSPTMRAMFVAWFAAMAVAPRAVARRLAEAFVFPERRRGLNRLLAHMHRQSRENAPAVAR